MRPLVPALLAALLLAGCATQPATPAPSSPTPPGTAPPADPAPASPPPIAPATPAAQTSPPEVPVEEPPLVPAPPREPPAPWSRTLRLQGGPWEVAAGTGGRVALVESVPDVLGNGTLHILDVSTGATLWSAPLEPAWWRSVVLWDERSFAAGTTPPGEDRTAYVEARDLETGARQWVVEEAADVGYADAIATDGTRVYLALSDMRGNHDAMVAYSAATGARLWAWNTTSPGGGSADVGQMRLTPDGSLLLRLAVGASDGWHSYHLVAHRTDTGEVAWEIPGGSRSRAIPRLAVGADQAFVALSDEADYGSPGSVRVLQVDHREGRIVSIWRHRAPDDLLVQPRRLVLDETNATLYVAAWRERPRGSFGPTLMAFDAARGALRWDVGPGHNLGEAVLARAGGLVLFGGVESVGGERGGGTKALSFVAHEQAGPVVGAWSAPPVELMNVPRLLVLDGRVLVAGIASRGFASDLHLHSFDLASILDPAYLERRARFPGLAQTPAARVFRRGSDRPRGTRPVVSRLGVLAFFVRPRESRRKAR